MDNLELNNQEIVTKVKKRKPKSLIILSILLAISIIGNVFLGISNWQYIKAYDVLHEKFLGKSNLLSITEGQLKRVKEDNSKMQENFSMMVRVLAQYNRDYKKLQDQMTASELPKGYYSSSGTGGNGSYEDLKNFLNYKFALPKDYKIGVFDCSESAAYLEWCLQNNGFDAKIAVGKDPSGSDVGHAWVFVNTSEGLIAVEPTVLSGGVKKIIESLANIANNSVRGVIYYDANNSVSKNYYKTYDAVFEDLSEAIKYTGNVDEWNWWEGSWGFE